MLFRSAMPDANYAYAICQQKDASDYGGYGPTHMQWPSHTKSTTALQFYTIQANQPANGQIDYPAVLVTITR